MTGEAKTRQDYNARDATEKARKGGERGGGFKTWRSFVREYVYVFI